MAFTNPKNPECENCNKSGLAILPVRYAVVPNNVDAALPDPLGNKVTDVKLKHHKYALRTLRQGFVYLFYEKHARGSQIKWEVYSVSEAGTLWKQYFTGGLKPVTVEPVCSRNGHNIPASIISIEKPEKCGKVWLAFSDHAWSKETFTLFSSDEKLRDRRMQTFLPSVWIKAGGYRHGLPASKENIEKVIEYKENFNSTSLTGLPLGEISTVEGIYNAARLKMESTCHALHLRKGESEKLAGLMQMVGEAKNAKANAPVIIALWDAFGITHELNGFRNEPAGWIKKYSEERELELTALQGIEGIRKTLENAAVANEEQCQEDTRNNAPQISSTQGRRDRAATLAEPQRSRETEICDLLDQWAREQVPLTMGFSARLNDANSYPEPARSIKVAKVKADADSFIARRKENAPAMVAKAKELSWSKYEERLEPGAYQEFRKKYDGLLDEAKNMIDDRTHDLIMWLESRALINYLSEFNEESIGDGIVFEDKIGSAINGMNSSVQGQEKITEWVKEMKAHETNLLWRALSLNQKELAEQFNTALTEAGTSFSEVGRASMDFLAAHVRKACDIYKKVNTMQNTLLKAADAAEGIKVIKVVELDRLFMTVGDLLFRPFMKRGADSTAEYAVRGLMMARAGVEPDRIISAIEIQAKQEGLARADIVRRLSTAKSFIGSGNDLKSEKYAALEKKWMEVKGDATKGPTALKENRLSLLVATLEIINLVKIAWEFKDDKKTLGELCAAICSTTAAILDIGANAAKHLVGDKVSVTFQYLKVYGGVLSAAAGYYSAAKEAETGRKYLDKENYHLAALYFSKSVVQFIAATLGLLSSLSYAAPLLKASNQKIMQWTGSRLLYYRLFSMTWAVRLNMVGLAITLIIWIVVPDALKEWCEKCPFGKGRDKGTKNPQILLEELGDAYQKIS